MFRDRLPPRDRGPRVNERIGVREVRVVGEDGEQLGILPTREALAKAKEQGLDLVEVAPMSRPPVCRIMDFGKFKYEKSKKEKAARKRQHNVEVKEIKMRPKIEPHDYEFKKKHIIEFLDRGDKVKITLQFRGREMAHTELGRRLLDQLTGELQEVAKVEAPPRQEGRQMILLLAPVVTRKKSGGDKARPGATATNKTTRERTQETEDHREVDTGDRHEDPGEEAEPEAARAGKEPE